MLSSSSSFLLIFCFTGTIAKNCVGKDDCIPYTSCKKANELAQTEKNNKTSELFKNAYCGMDANKIPKVCCTDFQPQPSVSFAGRFGIFNRTHEEKETRNTDPDDDVVHPNLKLLPTSCGDLYKNRIVGGIKASLYEFPWMALIAYPSVNRHVDFQCAGSLINARYVLTAAHCVQYKLISGVRIGEYNIHNNVDCEGNHCEKNLQEFPVQERIVHEHYEGYPSYGNDIALLRLENDVDLTQKNADPICLPVSRSLRNNSITNIMGTVAGWGLTENDTAPSELLKVMIPIHSQSDCKDHYRQLEEAEPKRFCAGLSKKDSCRGDSGGPLIIEAKYRGSLKFVQVGIVSVGHQKCGLVPGVYTDVRKYMDWILDNIRE